MTGQPDASMGKGASLMTPVQSLGLTWWKEKSDP